MRSSGLFRLDETHPDWIFKPFLQTSFHLNKPAEFKYHCLFFLKANSPSPGEKRLFSNRRFFCQLKVLTPQSRLKKWKLESFTSISVSLFSLRRYFNSLSSFVGDRLNLIFWFHFSDSVWGEVFSNEESGGVKVCLLSSAGELTWFGVNVVNVLTPLLLFTPKCHLPAGGRDVFH